MINKKKTEYTFKYNKNIGRHGWLRLTPAYSVKLVQELIGETPVGSLILDPFSGTATTGLCSAEQGYSSILCDINPFLVWFGNTKLSSFSDDDICKLNDINIKILELFYSLKKEIYWCPPIHNINRWWSEDTLITLSSLRYAIVELIGEPSDDNVHSLIWIAFCRLAIETSSAAFNHVSMSFSEEAKSHSEDFVLSLYSEIFNLIKNTANQQFNNNSKVILCDSRNLNFNGELKFNHVITSPPYPNRMSYIRELRPYMYWTKFLDKPIEAAELDWKAIGGTWGSATSKLKDWNPSNLEIPESLMDICDQILNKDDKNSELMSRYVHKYFYDMHSHFKNIRDYLSSNAKIDYIVGNSSFYGVKVPSDKIFEESLTLLGFENISSKIIRKRNSNKELYEYCVSGTYIGD